MLDVWGTPVMAEVSDIIDMLMIELRSSGSHLLAHRKWTGTDIMLPCISHKDGMEKKPSMGILTEDKIRDGKTHKAGTVNCFTCGYTADIAEFVSDCFGRSDRGYFGNKWIVSNFVNLAIEKRQDFNLNMSRKTAGDEQKGGVSESELDSYRYTHPYMYERMLTDRVIEYFDVGYDEKTRCLTFPVHDLDGVSLFFQRRSVEGKRFQNDVTDLKGGVLYGLYQVYKNVSWIDRLYITESPIDALTLWKYRMPAVATMQAIPTTTQIELLKRVPVRVLICAQDQDEAGDAGAARIKKHLQWHKLLYRVRMDRKDINKLDQDGLMHTMTEEIL